MQNLKFSARFQFKFNLTLPCDFWKNYDWVKFFHGDYFYDIILNKQKQVVN